jgi:hypothetical protein
MSVRFHQIIRTRSGKLGVVFFFGWIANAFACSIIASILGGDASSGHESAGRYFLGSHGIFTEVSKLVFQYSRIHTISMLASIPLALIGWLLLFYSYSQLDLIAQEQETANRHRSK